MSAGGATAMDVTIEFAAAALSLLLVPGPTNTLLAASGALRGFRASLPLIAAEVGGYMASICALLAVFGSGAAQRPTLTLTLKAAAALWLCSCALKLWREARQDLAIADEPAGFGRLFVATLLNPKALIFAFVIAPTAGLAGAAPWLAALCAMIAAAGLCWIALGAWLGSSSGPGLAPGLIRRAAALVLLAFAGALASSAVAAL